MEQTRIWKPVPQYEELYAVSNLGEVVRTKPYKNSSDSPLKGQMTYGYLRVNLCRNGKGRIFLVHRLVVAAFLGIPEGKVINHLNGIRTDNRLENLEVCTRKENEQHKRDVLKSTAYNNSKLNFDTAEQIRALLRKGVRPDVLAAQFGVTSGNIYHIKNGSTWKAR